MQCLFEYVMIEQDKAVDTTPGGIVLPDSHKERNRPFRGKVVAVGDMCKYVSVDDIVRFDPTGAFVEKIDDEVNGGTIEVKTIKEEKIFLIE